LGAAYFAGLAVGYWKSEEELVQYWQVEKRFEPSMGQEQRSALLAQWRRAIERAKAWEEGV
jgi:glycerol kinase